jgi:hypothetical protein
MQAAVAKAINNVRMLFMDDWEPGNG